MTRTKLKAEVFDCSKDNVILNASAPPENVKSQRVFKELPRGNVEIGGIAIARASRSELSDAALEDCNNWKKQGRCGAPRLVFDANGQGVSMFHSDAGFRAAMQKADIIHADGGFLITLSKYWFRKPIAERSATTDLIHDFAKLSQVNGMTFYLLGSTEKVNRDSARILQENYPGLVVAGRHNGYFSSEEVPLIIDEINSLAPDFLWVGLGKPYEQQFASQWRDDLKAGWLITSGGCFNFIAGNYRRAPRWMQTLNIEWVYRMLKDPRKLFWRYLTTSPHALWISLFKPSRSERF